MHVVMILYLSFIYRFKKTLGKKEMASNRKETDNPSMITP